MLAGSTARKAGTDTFPLGYRALRDQFVHDGRLVDYVDAGMYRFAADVTFGSPSPAASVVAARSASGPPEWKARGPGSCIGIGGQTSWPQAKVPRTAVDVGDASSRVGDEIR